MNKTTELGRATVLDLNGDAHPLAGFWADGPALLVFLRHYGWLFCREQAARAMAHFDEVRSVGGTLLAIGNGTPVMAQDFVEKFGIRYPVYTDPSRQTYALAELRKTFGMKFSTFGRAKRAMAAGHSQGRMAGNAWQQGGLLVVDSDGSVAFYHADGGPGEHGDLAAAVSALVDCTVV